MGKKKKQTAERQENDTDGVVSGGAQHNTSSSGMRNRATGAGGGADGHETSAVLEGTDDAMAATHSMQSLGKSKSQPIHAPSSPLKRGNNFGTLEKAGSWAPGQSPNRQNVDEVAAECALALDGKTPHELFACGLAYEAQGDVMPALACFRRCLRQGVETTNGEQPLRSLPAEPEHPNTEDEPEGAQLSLATCIRKISNLLGRKGDYDMALRYRQAEKLLYEKALLSVLDLEHDPHAAQSLNGEPPSGASEASPPTDDKAGMSAQQIIKEMYGEDQTLSKPTTATSVETSEILDRAHTYQTLSELLFAERKFDVAVDYASKAVKLRKAVQMEENRRAVEKGGDGQARDGTEDDTALESATLVDKLMHFSSVGKNAYQESMQRYLSTRTLDAAPKGVDGVVSTEKGAATDDGELDRAPAKRASQENVGAARRPSQEGIGEPTDGRKEVQTDDADENGMPLSLIVGVFAMILAVGLGVVGNVQN